MKNSPENKPTIKNIQNKFLLLHPLGEDELKALAGKEEEPVLAKLAAAALEGFRAGQQEAEASSGKKAKQANPWPWYTGWQARRREDGELLACFFFRGPQQHGEVQLRGLLFPAGESCLALEKKEDLCQQALGMLLQWAFAQDSCYFITSPCAEEDAAWKRLLQKCAFLQPDAEADSQLWELERPASTWMSVFMCMGLSVGLSLGLALFNNMSLGMGIGLPIGLCIGLALDESDKKLRKQLREARKQKPAG